MERRKFNQSCAGIRRCGKSTLFKMFIEHLKSEGVREEQIIFINFIDIDNEYLQDYKVLYDYVKQRLCKDEWTLSIIWWNTECKRISKSCW